MITSRGQELTGPDTIPTGGVPGVMSVPLRGAIDWHLRRCVSGPAVFSAATTARSVPDVALTTPATSAPGKAPRSQRGTRRPIQPDLTATSRPWFAYYLALFTEATGCLCSAVFPITTTLSLPGDLRGMDPTAGSLRQSAGIP